MANQPEIVPQGSISEKRQPHSYETHRRRINLELILVGLIFLLLALVLAVLVFGSINTIDTANRNLPVVTTVKP